MQLEVSGRTGVGIGKIERRGDLGGVSDSNGRVLPVSRGVGADGAAFGVGGGYSSGQPASQSVSKQAGLRLETTAVVKGTAENPGVIASTRVTYDMAFDSGGPLGRQEHVTASDDAHLSMFRSDYEALRARQEAMTPSGEGWRNVLGTGQSQPRGPVVGVDRTAASEPLRQALMEARLSNREVPVTVQVEGDKPRQYVAYQEAGTGRVTMRSADGPDGGFAAAFATLPPHLSEIADQHGVDLHQLFNSTQGKGTFADQIRERLKSLNVDVPDERVPVPPASHAGAEHDAGESVPTGLGIVDPGAGGI